MDSEDYSGSTYDPTRPYRPQMKMPVGTMEIPTHLNKASTSQANDSLRRQLEARRKTYNHLENRCNEAEADHSEAESAYLEFVALMKRFKEADNARHPTAEQTQIIHDLNESVANIQVQGPDNGVPELGRKMAEKALQLKKAKDTAWTSWNQATKVIRW